MRRERRGEKEQRESVVGASDDATKPEEQERPREQLPEHIDEREATTTHEREDDDLDHDRREGDIDQPAAFEEFFHRRSFISAHDVADAKPKRWAMSLKKMRR